MYRKKAQIIPAAAKFGAMTHAEPRTRLMFVLKKKISSTVNPHTSRTVTNMPNNEYPPGVSKRGYVQTVDDLGAYVIASALRKLRPDYIVLINPVPASDVDIWVYEDTRLVLVVEVQNWSRRSHPEDLDANNVRKIFEKYDAEKLLVTSLHFEVFDDLRKDDVAILELGFNILPRGWYEFYKSKGETEKFGMNYFNSETEGTIKTKLSEYLLEEDL